MKFVSEWILKELSIDKGEDRELLIDVLSIKNESDRMSNVNLVWFGCRCGLQ